MKKTYFNPAAMQFRQRLPMIESRRMGLRHYANAAYKTDGDDPSPDTATEEDLLKKINDRVQVLLESRATKEELEEIKKSMPEGLKGLPIEQLRGLADEKTGVLAMITRQGLEMQRLEKKFTESQKKENLSVRAQVAKWQEDNKDAIRQIRNGQRASLTNLEFRAVASPMTPATVNPTNSPWIGRIEVEPGINDWLRAQPTFWDYVIKGRTGAPTYVWVNKTNPQGEAAWLAPGELKPGISFELKTAISNAKKIADSAKAATELLEDIDGMTTFILEELRYAVDIKVNRTLLDSVGDDVTPTGIKQLSVPYTATNVTTTNGNYMDAILAVVAQIRSGLLTGDVTVFVNPADMANMQLVKAEGSGTYLIPPFAAPSGTSIGGATVVPEAGIPVGYMQAAILRYYRILIYKAFSTSWGWENDDFTRNLVTAVGEMRLHQFFNEQYTGAFVYDSFANVLNKIKPAATLEAPAE